MAAQCEICGGTRIVKETSGDYVCQDCGAAYSVDAMRIMLTGEVVDTPQKDLGLPTIESLPVEQLTKEEQLEFDVKESFDLGNYKRASGLLDEYFKEKRKIIGNTEPIRTSDIPFAYCLGRLAGCFVDIDSGKQAGGSIPSILARFADDIVEYGCSGSDAIKALSVVYIAAASGCMDRVNSKLRIAQERQESYRRYGDVGSFKMFVDAKNTAQLLLDKQRECCAQAVMGVAYILAIGLDADNEAMSLVKELRDSLESPSDCLPHVKAAARYIDGAMSKSRPEDRMLFSRGDRDAELVSCGKNLWVSGNYGLADRAFRIACEASGNHEATYYCSLYEELVKLTESTLLGDMYVKRVVDAAKNYLDSLVATQNPSAIDDLLGVFNNYLLAINDYSDYLLVLYTHERQDDNPIADETKKCESLLSSTIGTVYKHTLHCIVSILQKGVMSDDVPYLLLKKLCDNKLARDDEETAASVQSIKLAFLSACGVNADFSKEADAVRSANEAVSYYENKIKMQEKMIAGLGAFKRNEKQDAEKKLEQYRNELNASQKAAKDAQAHLDLQIAKIESAWKNLGVVTQEMLNTTASPVSQEMLPERPVSIKQPTVPAERSVPPKPLAPPPVRPKVPKPPC